MSTASGPPVVSSLAGRLLGIDTRALSAFRIGLGLLLLADLATRVPNLVAHYTDFGVLPREALESLFPHALFGGAGWAGFMFALSAVAALCLLVGYHTWVATLFCWFLLVSLQMRNALVNNSGDQLLALLLFWGLFLPLGAQVSVDRWRSARPATAPWVVLSPGSVALLVQVVSVYVFSALLKSGKVWWIDGQGAYLALNIDYQTTDVGRWVLGWPRCVEFFSRTTYVLELIGPFLAFSPWRNGFFRTATFLMFAGFHLALAITMELSLFSYICIVAWLPFLPASVWDCVERLGLTARVRAFGRRIVRRPVRAAAEPMSFGMARPAQVLAGVLAVYAFVWNVDTVWPQTLPASAKWLGRELYLGQRWRMFAPSPLRDDGWWIAPATLQDGTEIDLFTGEPARRDKSRSFAATLPTIRWNKYFENIWDEHRNKARYLGDWLRRRWDTAHDPSRHVVALELIFVVEWTEPDYAPPTPSDRRVYGWKRSR